MKLFSQYKGLRKEVYILFLGRIVTRLGSMVFPVLTLILNQKMGLNATQVALVTVISGLAVLPAGIIGGKLADSRNKKNVIIVCDIVSIILFIICGLIPLSYVTIALLVFAAAFQNLEDPVYTALIADITTTKDREKAYSLMYLGGNIGLVASPTIAGLLFKDFLWLSFLITAVAIASSTILIYFMVRDIRPIEECTKDAEYQQQREGSNLLTVLRENKLIFVFIIIETIFWVAYDQVNYLLPLDIGRIHGENGALIFGSVTSLNCIEVVLFTPLFTRLFLKLASTKKFLVGQILVLIGYILFLCTLGHIPFYYVAMALFTFGEIMASIACGPFIANRVPSSHRGRVNGFKTFLHSVLYGVAMYGLGLIYDNKGNVTAWISLFATLLLAIAGCIALIFWDRRKFPNLYTEEQNKQPVSGNENRIQVE